MPCSLPEGPVNAFLCSMDPTEAATGKLFSKGGHAEDHECSGETADT